MLAAISVSSVEPSAFVVMVPTWSVQGRVAEDAEHRPGQVIAVIPVGDLRTFRGLPHLHLPGADEGDREVRLRAVRLDDRAVDLWRLPPG